jgi:hypothetical protein
MILFPLEQREQCLKWKTSFSNTESKDTCKVIMVLKCQGLCYLGTSTIYSVSNNTEYLWCI